MTQPWHLPQLWQREGRSLAFSLVWKRLRIGAIPMASIILARHTRKKRHSTQSGKSLLLVWQGGGTEQSLCPEKSLADGNKFSKGAPGGPWPWLPDGTPNPGPGWHAGQAMLGVHYLWGYGLRRTRAKPAAFSGGRGAKTSHRPVLSCANFI